METKLFEVRDRLTFLPVVAIKMAEGENDHENYLLHRAGYGHNPVILLTAAKGGCETHYDYHEWGNRTLIMAHKHIIEAWDTLSSGDVIDVEFILGETAIEKLSERDTA